MSEWINIKMPCIVRYGTDHHSGQVRCFLLSESQDHRQEKGQEYTIGYLVRKELTGKELSQEREKRVAGELRSTL